MTFKPLAETLLMMLQLALLLPALLSHQYRKRVIVAAFRGIKKHGGRVLLGAHVEQIELQDGKASGVRLRGGDRIVASKAVVSNASLWDTLPMLPKHKGAQKLRHRAEVRLQEHYGGFTLRLQSCNASP